MLEEVKTKNIYQKLFLSCLSESSDLDCEDETYDGLVFAYAILKGHLPLGTSIKGFHKLQRHKGLLVWQLVG